MFKKGDACPQLVYLISGEITLQAAGLIVEVIAANNDSAKFALAHQIPRKIDALANGKVRFLRLNADIVNNPLSLANKEDNSYMVIDETDGDSDDWMTALLRSPIFQRLPPANLQKIIMGLEAVHYKKGEIILEQGGVGDYYYLIKSGQCLLTRKPSPNAKEIKLAQLGNGDTFGEDSLLSGAPRNVTITALTDISLLRLDKNRFISLIKEPSLKFVNFAEMQEAVKRGAVLLDVSSQDEYEHHHLDGSINAPFFSLRMQLKTLSLKLPVVVVCQDGKTSEAAAFLLLRHKIDAMILRGGMESLAAKPNAASEPENKPSLSSEESPESNAHTQPASSPTTAATHSSLEDQIRILKLENEALKNINHQLNDKCMKLEFDKQHAEKQCRILHKQMEKLTQVLDKLKGG
ncbi:cyclic nucleotide-binding domain-containing protein [Candidatus Methylobacter oryzae]|uniref:cyclic nucleotide-binding domain-containing protein n=1 Tax=Candidatus Methylobacter oryzae TaxID=2497749 RepID=UPI001F4FCBF2|nr:cyclic nucleotide-binding domain-containing protein [Candidatus Methylobacter oryzae]